MELRRLRYFLTVAEEEHLGRAAARLHMTQPPLSRQIRRLEDDIGVRLFERTPRGVTLTEPGRVLVDEARRILDLADSAAEQVQRAAEGAVGRIDVAVFGTGIFHAIPIMLRAFRLRHPEVDLVMHDMTKEEQLEALAAGRIDFAFNRLIPSTPGITSEVLLDEDLYAAVSTNHPLATAASVSMVDLEGQPLVVFPTGIRPSFIDRVSQLCRAAGFEPRIGAESDDVVHGLALVSSGGYCCLVPQSATNVRMPGVAYRPLDEVPRPTVELCGVYREGDPSPLLGQLLGSLRETAPTITAPEPL